MPEGEKRKRRGTKINFERSKKGLTVRSVTVTQ